MAELHLGLESTIFVTKPPNNIFDCALCLNIFNDPRQCLNGHCFCKVCIESSLKKFKHCPICKVNITDLGKNIVAQNTVEVMETFCQSTDLMLNPQFKLAHCPWTGPLHSRVSHYENKCGNFALTCGAQIARSQFISHTKENCLYRKIRCDFCGDDKSTRLFTVSKLEEHKAKCWHRLVACECSALVQLMTLLTNIDHTDNMVIDQHAAMSLG